MYTAIKILTATLLTVVIHFNSYSQNLKKEAIIVPSGAGNFVHLSPNLKFEAASKYKISMDINWNTEDDSLTLFLNYRNENKYQIQSLTFFIEDRVVNRPVTILNAKPKGYFIYYRLKATFSYDEIKQFLISEKLPQFAIHFKNGQIHNCTQEAFTWGERRVVLQNIFQELELLKL